MVAVRPKDSPMNKLYYNKNKKCFRDVMVLDMSLGTNELVSYPSDSYTCVSFDSIYYPGVLEFLSRNLLEGQFVYGTFTYYEP